MIAPAIGAICWLILAALHHPQPKGDGVNADQRAVKVRAALHAWWDTDVNDADALQAAGNQLAVQLTAIGADFDWRPPCPDIIPKEDR